jgi:hypothetical protein
MRVILNPPLPQNVPHKVFRPEAGASGRKLTTGVQCRRYGVIVSDLKIVVPLALALSLTAVFAPTAKVVT